MQAAMGTGNAQTSTLFKTRGTAGSRSVVQSNVSGGNAYCSNGGQNSSNFDFSYTDFTRMGDATNPMLTTNQVGLGFQQTFDHCTFTACKT